MTKKVVALIERTETNQIEIIFERINSLKELLLTLEDNKTIIEDNSSLYRIIIEDYHENRIKFNMWWNQIYKKYNLNKDFAEKYSVDFMTNEISLND